MKREVRILASRCRNGTCVALIVRGPGVDGALASCTGCDGICKEASRRGYMGELRYHYGPCTCGLPPYPGSMPQIDYFLDAVLESVEQLARARGALSDPDPVA